MSILRWPLLCIASCCLLFFSINSWADDSHSKLAKQKLIILNWAEYLDPQLIKKFEQQFNAQVSEIYYESDEHRTQILIDNQAQGFDVILSSGINLEPYVNHGWIAPLELSLIPNRSYLSARWLMAFPMAENYAVPYFWGTTGILYRQDLVTQSIDSWMDFFAPAKNLQGKIGMVSDGNEIISLALKALGYSINEGSAQALAEVDNLLSLQQPYVRSYQYMGVEEDSEILSGDLWMTLAYSGDALMVMENDKHNQLAFMIPKEGTNLWVDYFTIGAHSQNPQLAHAFLNFINDPHNAAQAALYTYSATPNEGAKKYVIADYLDNPIIFPPLEIMEKSEQFHPIPAQQLRRRNMISSKWVGGGKYAIK